jgi:hypothetical protein
VTHASQCFSRFSWNYVCNERWITIDWCVKTVKRICVKCCCPFGLFFMLLLNQSNVANSISHTYNIYPCIHLSIDVQHMCPLIQCMLTLNKNAQQLFCSMRLSCCVWVCMCVYACVYECVYELSERTLNEHQKASINRLTQNSTKIPANWNSRFYQWIDAFAILHHAYACMYIQQTYIHSSVHSTLIQSSTHSFVDCFGFD